MVCDTADQALISKGRTPKGGVGSDQATSFAISTEQLMADVAQRSGRPGICRADRTALDQVELGIRERRGKISAGGVRPDLLAELCDPGSLDIETAC